MVISKKQSKNYSFTNQNKNAHKDRTFIKRTYHYNT